MIAVLMGTGLAAAAGLNAYIPVLLVGLVARWTDVLTLPGAYHWIEHPVVLGVVAVLLVSELLLDKIPVVDTVNDALGTVIRPVTGGLIFAAAQAADQIEGSTWMRDHQWLGVALGVAVAATVHSVKAISRPVINVTTAGAGGPIVSTAEDASALTLSLIAIFTPILVIGGVVVLGSGLRAMWIRVASSRRQLRDLGTGAPSG